MHPLWPFLALTLALPAAAAAPSRPITLQRVEAKKENPAPVKLDWNGPPLAVAIYDGRGSGDPAVVGSQVEKGTLIYEWRTADPVPEAVTKQIEQALRSFKIETSADAKVTLKLQLSKYFVDEVPETFGSSYRAEVELTGAITDPDATGGRLIPLVRGTAKRTGPDGKAKICNEVLTTALEDALTKMFAPKVAQPSAAAPAVDASDPSALRPKAMLNELVRLKEAGVSEPIMLNYVRQHRLSAPLSADDILAWQQSGLPESVIRAAQEAK